MIEVEVIAVGQRGLAVNFLSFFGNLLWALCNKGCIINDVKLLFVRSSRVDSSSSRGGQDGNEETEITVWD